VDEREPSPNYISRACRRFPSSLDDLRKLPFERCQGFVRIFGPADGDLQDLLSQMAAAGQNGTNAACLRPIFDQVVSLRRQPVFPTAIENMQLNRSAIESVLVKRQLQVSNRDGSESQVVG
jgi:hypothetical protein